MDTTAVLDKYTQDLSNLPLEVKHLFDEIKAKDQQLAEARRRYQSKDSQLHKFIRANGTLTKHPKEVQLNQKVEEEMKQMQSIQKEKILLANTALFLVSKHMFNFEVDIQKLERDDLLAPVDEDALEDSVEETASATPRDTPDPVKKKRSYSVMRRYKRLKSEDLDDGRSDESTPEVSSRAHHNALGPRAPSGASGEDADNNLYCFCQRISFGEMIGCDNDDFFAAAAIVASVSAASSSASSSASGSSSAVAKSSSKASSKTSSKASSSKASSSKASSSKKSSGAASGQTVGGVLAVAALVGNMML
ncbi:hypothetical protein CXQ85_003804 [Candidozyma haemuli]|uniref:Inhibitor of growth protein N-terminal histone-binding domain-containing protein n=1 Tax=Candidozyma haemuli TaxID=45357 RepID=A0A2V1B0G8_9ASCO|nr:hypothetical protein CXQ85_003804 [[Candida] haemuloni]PVH23514.1 hypothetical protein CXQ85_003804 [[Candida] haemuloni]